jgi:hypothetical protein
MHEIKISNKGCDTYQITCIKNINIILTNNFFIFYAIKLWFPNNNPLKTSRYKNYGDLQEIWH